MTLTLQIFTENQTLKEYYLNKAQSSFHEGDSGFDLIFPNDFEIQPGETLLAKLGIKCTLKINDVFLKIGEKPKYVSYLLMPRSSIIKTKLRMANSLGLIDAGYRGEIAAAIDNIGSTTHYCKKGERLFQIVAPSLEPFKIEVVDKLEDLGTTTRGEGGFGSTNSISA